MSFKVNSSIEKLRKKTKYTLQITTDNYEQFLFMQKMAAECANGKEDIKSDPETFPEHYEPFDYQKWLPNTEFNYPCVNLTDIPACCVNCPNHPSNGGSGICNCVAPYIGQTTSGIKYSINTNNEIGTYSTTLKQYDNNPAQPDTISCNKV